MLERPTSCLCEDAGDECSIKVHQHRTRKYGPEHAVTVFWCKKHGMFFTVYPLGYTPYGRYPVVLLDESKRIVWSETMFRAVVEVVTNTARTDGARVESVHTRDRGVTRTASWFGVVGSVSVADAVTGILSIPLNVVRSARNLYSQADGLQARAQAVNELLDVVSPGPELLLQILHCGYKSGQCGRAWRAGEGGALVASVPF